MQDLFDILMATIAFLGITLVAVAVLIVVGLIAAIHAARKEAEQPWNQL